jgi:1,4-dihydroxy-2-naphthoyl-CoA synthase
MDREDERMSEAHILYLIEGHIAKLILNRPEAKNAFSPEMITLWNQFLEEARADDTVRVIILTGRGDTFCSGDAKCLGAESDFAQWVLMVLRIYPLTFQTVSPILTYKEKATFVT